MPGNVQQVASGLVTAYEHALKLLTDGKYSFALPQFYAVLTRYQEHWLYGPALSDTLTVMDNLAVCLYSLERPEEAVVNR